MIISAHALQVPTETHDWLMKCTHVYCYFAAGMVAKCCDEHVCLCVCPPAYLRNHTCSLYQFFCACCLWPWFGPPLAGWRNPKSKGQFWGLSGPFKIFAAAIAAAFAAKGIIQSIITSCSRRDHLRPYGGKEMNVLYYYYYSVCQASGNRNPENSEHMQCSLLAGKWWWECRARMKSDIYDCLVTHALWRRPNNVNNMLI